MTDPIMGLAEELGEALYANHGFIGTGAEATIADRLRTRLKQVGWGMSSLVTDEYENGTKTHWSHYFLTATKEKPYEPTDFLRVEPVYVIEKGMEANTNRGSSRRDR